jgi:hypothetical protein
LHFSLSLVFFSLGGRSSGGSHNALLYFDLASGNWTWVKGNAAQDGDYGTKVQLFLLFPIQIFYFCMSLPVGCTFPICFTSETGRNESCYWSAFFPLRFLLYCLHSFLCASLFLYFSL